MNFGINVNIASLSSMESHLKLIGTARVFAIYGPKTGHYSFHWTEKKKKSKQSKAEIK